MSNRRALTTGREQVEFGTIDIRAHIEHAEDGVKEVVVAELLPRFRADTGDIEKRCPAITRRGPEHHRDMLLRVRSEHVGHAMEIDAAFAKGLAVIRDIEHRGVEAPGGIFENVDRLRQNAVRVENRVVIGVDDLLLRTGLKLVRVASRRKAAIVLRVALEV